MDHDKLVNTIDISHYMIDEEAINLVIPGDKITAEEGYMQYGWAYAAGTAPTRGAGRSTLR